MELVAMNCQVWRYVGKSLRITVILGTKISNWENSEKYSTLFHDLMKVESITTKNIVKGKFFTIFTDRLFYAIVPDNVSKIITFYYTRTNAQEECSVA